MTLQQLYEQAPPQQRALQFGVDGGDALTGAFPQKLVVHAGLQGSLVSPEESQKIWQDLMGQAPTGKEVQTAYIHIPFCKTKCLYCGFFQNGMDQSVEDEYIRCLVRELRQAAKARRLRDSLIHAVFIGGGTPTSLSADNAARLLGAVRDCLPLANDYELTLEGRVHDLEPEKIDTWLAYGVNRISLGVQSFDTKVRRSVGRLDDRDTVLERLAALKAYGQCVVVIDLMYGLPGQTMDVWMEDVRTFAESGIDGADLYQLNVFEGSALNRAIRQGTLPPPCRALPPRIRRNRQPWPKPCASSPTPMTASCTSPTASAMKTAANSPKPSKRRRACCPRITGKSQAASTNSGPIATAIRSGNRPEPRATNH